MQDLIHKLTLDFPDLQFKPGKSFCWSPKSRQITFRPEVSSIKGSWAILHELAHAQLGHRQYSSDFELVKLEVSAWYLAREIGKHYSFNVDDEHIQNCLDTYRDWLHRRSTCPICGNRCLQDNATQYRCFNCHTMWKVSTSRFCRPYRQLERNKQKSPVLTEQAIFT